VSKLTAALLICFASAAFAQVRTIPQDAKRGEMRYIPDMTVEVNGQQLPLAPGIQIRDTLNMILVPAALPDKTLVKYRLDGNGMVRQVWILTPEEAAASAPANPFPR
jgi:hypothetical protein